jgi:GNAT superfamily N-acetyltransferase
MQATVRQAVAADADPVARVHILTWQAAYRGQIPDSYLDGLNSEVPARVEFWRKQIASQNAGRHEIWVASLGPELEAFAALGPAREEDPSVTGEVYAIYVNPSRWGQGRGRALFAHSIKRLASLGYATAILWVLESNNRARRFYEIAGWILDGATKTEKRPDGIELREVRYRIDLCREEE